MSDELNRLIAAVRQANQDLDNHLRAAYPKGMRVGVRLKHGQVNPTWGVVHSHWSGNLQVHFESARKAYRMINPSDVMEIGAAA